MQSKGFIEGWTFVSNKLPNFHQCQT